MSSVPVSQYEALRAEMRNLVEQAQKVHEIAAQVISTTASTASITSLSSTNHLQIRNDASHSSLDAAAASSTTSSSSRMDTNATTTATSKLSNYGQSEFEGQKSAGQMSISSEPTVVTNASRPNNLYHGTWPVEKTNMWTSEPASNENLHLRTHHNIDQQSVRSFASSSGGAPLDGVLGSSPEGLSRRSMQQLEAKVDMVYSLLAMLGGQEHADMGDTLLALSTSSESCLAMRQSGCIPLLVQLVQSDKDSETRKKASQALQNLVYSQPDERLRKKETRVLKLLNQARGYIEALRNNLEFEVDVTSSGENQDTGLNDQDRHPVPIIANLMKHSFDEGHRQAICQLGGIHIIASLVEIEHSLHGSTTDNPQCILLRRYACMALTNLTFGDSGNKALLCSFREFMRALVVQLQSPSDELRQVTASVLRNLSWRADQTSKDILREVGTVSGLMKAGMMTSKENTLKSILSALWNLSAHCTENKLEICAIEGGLGFLVEMLSYKAPSKSLTINENAGGILRNISSQIAVRDDYREILRGHNFLQVLLEQLKSPSLTIVSNACGALWNLSAKNQVDQDALWQMGAPAMLRSLNDSKHKMIATGSSAALKNLLNSRPQHSLVPTVDATAKAMDLPVLPTLGVRKQKALLRDLDENLSETFETLERESPTKISPEEQFSFEKTVSVVEKKKPSNDKVVARSESREFGTRNDYHKNVEKDLVNGFSNLSVSVDQPSTSYHQKDTKSRSFAGSNNMFITTRDSKSNYLSGQNYPGFSDEQEQPIDYSKKYTNNKIQKFRQEKKANYQYKEKMSKNYGMYAETDLDQPTDYSLRYAEDDSGSDCDKKDSEFVQDTVKTYYTEGTPYDTPINFSNATSMSDLRGDIDNDKSKDKNKKKAPLTHLDEKDHCSVEDITDLDKEKSAAVPGSEFSSGLMSPEKPVKYCEEGTPGYFSRVSSCGSLNSMSGKPKKESNTPPLVENNKKLPAASEKAVKFESSVNYAEQTPLMFSRSSSLASLDSVEQHSIHDDRSSIVSDFSRLTSGIVSPSEIPDSPTQTVPPSPRPRKAASEDYPSTSRFNRSCVDGRPMPAPRSINRSSVFEDRTMKFKEESTPVQFSTGTSISSLTIDDHDEPIGGDIRVQNATAAFVEESGEKQDVQEKCADSSSEYNEQLSDNEEDNDEDDHILADCISIGMQNNRHRQSRSGSPMASKIPSFKPMQRPGSGIPVPRSGIPTSRPCSSKTSQPALNSDTLRTYCTEDTPALSQAGSHSDLSVLSIQTDQKSMRKDYLSDDSSNLSGDNENILAECIQSGMPKAKVGKPLPASRNLNLNSSTPVKPFGNLVQESERKMGLQQQQYFGAVDEIANFAVENSPCQFSLRSSLSEITVDGSIAGGLRTMGEGESEPKSLQSKQSTPGPSVHNTSVNNESRQLSRQGSLSSLSVESFGSGDAEQALLDQCISSGMPKSKQNVTPNKGEKPIGVATKQFNQSVSYTGKEKENNVVDEAPKNVNAASVVENTKAVVRATGDEEEKCALALDQSYLDSSPVKSSHTEENLLTALTKSGCEKSLGKILDNSFTNSSYSNSDNCANLDKSEDELKPPTVDSRMLDPDAMMESLDRFTAELVSQATQNKEENKISSSINADGDTWNDDLTFPSISGEVPEVVTFESEPVKPPVVIDGPPSNDFSSLNSSTMTDSTIIAMEAIKMVSNIQKGEMTKSGTSVGSLELENIQPPSQMNSISGAVDMSKKSPKVIRKRSVPAGLMVRRALSNSLNQCGSLENLIANNSLTNLEQINQPSLMGEVIDMDGSLVSVASISSDNGDFSNGRLSLTDKPNPIFNIKQPMSHLLSSQLTSLTAADLENVNPPSLFNEVTDMCNSLADAATENMETTFEDCNTYCDVTEFSDANSITPIQSDISSAESTPKKSKGLTPKDRRNMSKERYMTYTVDPVQLAQQRDDDSSTDDYRSACANSESFKTANNETYVNAVVETYSTATFTRSPSKLTPKDRRQQDVSRYQTQVMKPNDLAPVIQGESESPQSSPMKSRIGVRKNLLQKRSENKDRYKTQTIMDSSALTITQSSTSSTDFQLLVQQEANLVLKSLNDPRKHEELMDETLSLVSDDSEPNSRCSLTYRTYRKNSSSKITPNMPVIDPAPAAAAAIDSDQICFSSEDERHAGVKPKIVKPLEKPAEIVSPSQDKAIRGRRKLLYSKAIKAPIQRSVTPPRQPKIGAAKPPMPKLQKAKTAPISPSLQREGTFTKDEKKSKIPTTGSSSGIPRTASASRIAKPLSVVQGRSKLPGPASRTGLVKSASSDRAYKPSPSRLYSRSPSVDSSSRSQQQQQQQQVLKTSPTSSSSPTNGAVKKTTPNPTSKQITSRIASLWKQVEQNKKKQVPKKDTRVWIQANGVPDAAPVVDTCHNSDF